MRRMSLPAGRGTLGEVLAERYESDTHVRDARPNICASRRIAKAFRGFAMSGSDRTVRYGARSSRKCSTGRRSRASAALFWSTVRSRSARLPVTRSSRRSGSMTVRYNSTNRMRSATTRSPTRRRRARSRPKRRKTWRRGDSNSRHPACKAGALPTELRPRATRFFPRSRDVLPHRPCSSGRKGGY